MAYVRRFLGFWYDFVVGDDWRVAVGVALALGVTAVLAHTLDVAAWWLMPVAAVSLLSFSTWRRATS